MFPGRSPYEYCFSNPINYTDPTGMSPDGGGNGEIQGPLTQAQQSAMDRYNSQVQSKIPFTKQPLSHSDALSGDGGEWLDEVVVTGKGGYTKADRVLQQGLAFFAHKLNRSHTYFDFADYTEAHKQNIFKESAEKTIAVMMYEFGSETHPEGREFGPTSAISRNLKWSYTARKALKHYFKSEAKNLETVRFYSGFSPDKVSIRETIKSHILGAQDMSFYLGGMTFYMTRTGKVLNVRIEDAYTTASGITRDDNAYTGIKAYPIIINITYDLPNAED